MTIYVYRNQLTPRIWMCDTWGPMRSQMQHDGRTGWGSWEAAYAEAERIAEGEREQKRRYEEAKARVTELDREQYPWLYDEED
jgi:hypothetical protein